MTFLVFVLALGGVAGFFIGCVGIGGVVLVPVLTLAGVEVHGAIAACMFSYMFCAVAGAWMFARKGLIDWNTASWLCLAAVPGALLGAFAAAALSAAVLEALIAAGLLLSAFRAFAPERKPASRRRPATAPLLIAGALTGFLSALTGTSGPLVLVPILLWFDVPMLTVVGLSQAIQMPIALLATLGNLAATSVDWQLGLLLALGLTAGTFIGAYAAHVMPAIALKRVAGCIMLLAGGIFIVRLIHQYAWPT